VLWNAFMANSAHPLQNLTHYSLLTSALLLLELPPASAQAPPGVSAVENRTADNARGSLDRSKISATRHPLDPLQPAEIELAVAAIRKERALSESVRFVTVSLKEPSKEAGRQTSPAVAWTREAFVILLDSSSGRGYEAVVDLGNGAVKRYEALPEGVQPPIMTDEFMECEDAVKRAPEFREAMKKRGIDDVGLIMVDAWSAGHYGNEPTEDRGKRLVRALCWIRAEPRDNGYARPIENIVAVVDLNRKQLVRLEDYGAIPLPRQNGNWAREYNPDRRAELKPLDVTQSKGTSFKVDGHEVQWDKWSFRVGFNPREGLVLYTVGYDGRPVLYRASIAEMMVPYADPKQSSYHKNVFDLGEYGVGAMANSLALGCDCLGTIQYFDGHMADSKGRVVTIKNAICLHEEDFGMLWKHTDWRTGQSDVRRSRRLAVSMVATVGNYDYGFYWYLYQDGTIQMEVKLTGIMNTTAFKPDEPSKYGTAVAPGLNAPYHQHYFNARLDFAVDGEANTVQEVNMRGLPAGPENPFNSAFIAETRPLLKELEAQRTTNTPSARFWRVVNPERKNAMGQPVAYRLCPGENTLPYALPGSSLVKRATFLTRNLWVTPFDPHERFPAGEYPNQNPGGDGLPKWTAADREIADRDLVVWYTFGQTHTPRLEDWPVMPVSSVGFMLRPDGFFDRNPTLDLPPPL
jgi:primary-amine oxidase